MIPRTIHQIWIGPKPRPERMMATWVEKNPAFKYELWDEVRCATFGFRNEMKIAEQHEWAGKADLMRYEILERHGGIFVDADSECLLPLGDDFLTHDAFACYENETVRPGLISNGYLGATQGCRLMRLLMHVVSGRDMSSGRAWLVTGPQLLTDVVAQMGYEELKIYPSHFFIPHHYSGQSYVGDGPIYARQHWGSTLHSYDSLSGPV